MKAKDTKVYTPASGPFLTMTTTLDGQEIRDPQVDDQGWPLPMPVSGEEAHVAALLHRLHAIHDVGHLKDIITMVLAHAKSQHVRPEVLSAACAPFVKET